MDKSWSEKAANGLSKTIDIFVVGVFILALLYSGFALWDSWRIIDGAKDKQANLMTYKPSEEKRASFEELLALNNDVVAWLTVHNTNIDYPVVQGEDNYEYLSKDIEGNHDVAGSIFLVSENSSDFTDNYSMIMGHHMQADAMFGNLDLFKDNQFFFKNTTAVLYLPDRVLWLESVALVEPDAYDPTIYSVPSSDMGALASYIKKTATYYRPDVLKSDDQLIALSTCASYETNKRTVMVYRVVNEAQYK